MVVIFIDDVEEVLLHISDWMTLASYGKFDLY